MIGGISVLLFDSLTSKARARISSETLSLIPFNLSSMRHYIFIQIATPEAGTIRRLVQLGASCGTACPFFFFFLTGFFGLGAGGFTAGK